MKRIVMIGIILISALPALADALTRSPTVEVFPTCDYPIVINVTLGNHVQNVNKVLEALALRGVIVDDRREICFEIVDGNSNPAELEITSDDLQNLNIDFEPLKEGIFTLSVPMKEPADIYVTGLHLKRADNMVPADKPTFEINHIGLGKVVVKDSSITGGGGIVLTGDKPIELSNVSVMRDPAVAGSCFDIQSDGAILSGITAIGCDVGVLIDANGVIIQNDSQIYKNKIGVYILEEFHGTQIIGSRIYANYDFLYETGRRYDGVRFENQSSGDPIYYNPRVQVELYGRGEGENEMQQVPDEGDDCAEIDGKAFIRVKVDENYAVGGRVELFLSDDAECALSGGLPALGQSCGLISDMPIPFDSEEIDDEGEEVNFELPVDKYNKELVAVYTNDELGTSGFSRTFRVNEQGPIAIISAPFDIPAENSATETGPSIDDTGSDDPALVGDGIGGASGDAPIVATPSMPAAAAGCGMSGASLMGDVHHHVSLMTALWWIIFSALSFSSFSLAKVKAKRKS